MFQYKKIFFDRLNVMEEFKHGDIDIKRGFLKTVASGSVQNCEGGCCFYINLPNIKDEGIHSAILADNLKVGDTVVLKIKRKFNFFEALRKRER